MKGATVTSLLLLATIQAAMCAVSPDTKSFFPQIKNNLTQITWAHAVNSKSLLDEALKKADIMMLEADVVLGSLNTTLNTTGNNSIPIMAHPPNTTSDLSLEEFLRIVVATTTEKNVTKGIKLDFKTLDAFAQSKPILEKNRNNLTFPVFVNADILPGPGKSNPEPVNAKGFLSVAKAFQEYTLSVGWTTENGATENTTDNRYTTKQVEDMIKTLTEQNVTQPITYPVRASLAANGMDAIKMLMEKSAKMNNATLTIWSSENDNVDADRLSSLIREVGVEKVYVDVPANLRSKLQLSGASGLNVTFMMILASLLVCVFVSPYLRRI